MDLSVIITTIISSSVIATILSSIISIKLKNLEFRNEYYKIVINKRLQAYEHLESIIARLKTSVLDEDDGKAYHLIFSYTAEKYFEFIHELMITNSFDLWVNSDTKDKFGTLRNVLNQISFDFETSDEKELVKAGKDNYKRIFELRNELETLVLSDVLSLHKIDKIKSKKILDDNYQIINYNKKRA
jgi:hypothetical protein